MAVARRPVPEAPAAHDRLGLRRRPPRRAHRPARRRLGDQRRRRTPTSTCVPEPVRDAFSQRTGQVEAQAGRADRALDATSTTAPIPTPHHRPPRTHAPSSPPDPPRPTASTPPTLHADWAGQARAVGLRPRPARTARPLVAARRQLQLAGRRDADRRGAAPGSSEESSTWLRADLARHIATLVPPTCRPAPPRWSPRSTGSPLAPKHRCVALGPEPDRCDPLDATADRSPSTSPTGASPPRRSSTRNRTSRHWAEPPHRRAGRPATDPQSAAASGDRRSRPAGAGRRTRRDRQDHHHRPTPSRASSAQGRPVVGLAPSGKAADVLATEAGCQTDTLAGFLTRHRSTDRHRWPAGTTVVLDEAGMATTDDLARLVDLVRPHRLATRRRRRPRPAPRRRPRRRVRPLVRHPPPPRARHPATVHRRVGSRSQPRPPRRRPRRRRTPTPTTTGSHTAHPALVARPGRPRPPATTSTPGGPSPSPPTTAETARADQPGDPAPHATPTRPAIGLADGTTRRRRRPDRHPPQRPATSRTDRGRAGPQPPHLDRHRHRPRRQPHRRPPRPRHRRPPRRLRRPPRRARLGRHRLRQPRRHRRHRHRRPRTRHHPQPRLRRHDPRPRREPRPRPRPHRHPRPRRTPHPDHHPHPPAPNPPSPSEQRLHRTPASNHPRSRQSPTRRVPSRS